MIEFPKTGMVIVKTEKDYNLVLLILDAYGKKIQHQIEPFFDNSDFKTFIYWDNIKSYVAVSIHLTINDFNKHGYPPQILEEILKY